MCAVLRFVLEATVTMLFSAAMLTAGLPGVLGAGPRALRRALLSTGSLMSLGQDSPQVPHLQRGVGTAWVRPQEGGVEGGPVSEVL